MLETRQKKLPEQNSAKTIMFFSLRSFLTFDSCKIPKQIDHMGETVEGQNAVPEGTLEEF